MGVVHRLHSTSHGVISKNFGKKEGHASRVGQGCGRKAYRSAKAISGSIIQNSAKCRVVCEFSARNVGPNV
jgi:hypothetical protein